MDISSLFYILETAGEQAAAAATGGACQGLGSVIQFIHSVYTVLQWGIPIVLIVYGGFDLAKAVIASDDKEIKAASTKLVKRLIAAVAIFLLATIVNVIIGWAADASGSDKTGWWNCWNSSGAQDTE